MSRPQWRAFMHALALAREAEQRRGAERAKRARGFSILRLLRFRVG